MKMMKKWNDNLQQNHFSLYVTHWLVARALDIFIMNMKLCILCRENNTILHMKLEKINKS